MTEAELRSRPGTSVSRRVILRGAGRLAYAAPAVVVTHRLDAFTDQAQAADHISGGTDATFTPTPPPGVNEPPGGGKRPPPPPGNGDTPSGRGPRPPVADTDDSDDALEISHVRVLPNTGDGGRLRPARDRSTTSETRR